MPLESLEEDVVRVRTRLREIVRLSSVSQRQIEERLGWSRGYLSQVLQGHITLSIAHVLAILKTLDAEPAQFFHSLFGGTTEKTVIHEIREKLARYDEAFAQLRAKGLLDGTEASGRIVLDDNE